jgi:hypothetical protein
MSRNADIEAMWVEAWNQVYDLLQGRTNLPCIIEDGSVVSIDDCLGWLQNSVYEGFSVKIEEGWIGHRKGIIATRWKRTN